MVTGLSQLPKPQSTAVPDGYLFVLTSRQTFHDVLEIMFRKWPGYKRVTARDYEIEGQEGQVIIQSGWQDKILPGVKIAMNILLRQSPS